MFRKQKAKKTLKLFSLRITSLKNISKLDAWICSIAKNTAKNLLTRKINHNNQSILYEIVDTSKVPNDIIQLSD